MNNVLCGDIEIVKYNLEYIDEEISKLSQFEKKVNLIDYYSSEVFSLYSITVSMMKRINEGMSLPDLGIYDYLCCIHNSSEFQRVSERLNDLLRNINTNSKADFHSYFLNTDTLKELGIDKTIQLSAHMAKVAQLREELRKMCKIEDTLYWRIYGSIRFEQVEITDEIVQFVIAEYCRYIKLNHNKINNTIRSAAMKFKADRQDKLSGQHWAKLANMLDEIINKVIKGETICDGKYDDFFSKEDLDEFSKNKVVMEFVKKTSDDELLYNFERALYDYDMVHTINEDYVYFFFDLIHMENLIKCELFETLKEEYDAFLGRREFEAPNVENDSFVTPEINAEGLIHKRIDEAKLINFIRNYTEGPNKSNYFDKKSYWLSIYIVLRQNIEQLDNQPIFLPSSRPKFVEWVNEMINPSTIPCTKGALDSTPSYFRDENNYPWSLSNYHKANGKQESTYNGYSMVADYFMQHLIGKIDDFLTD